VILLAIVPTAVFTDYRLFQMTMVVVYAVAILGLAILTGINGQISLGHGAFYAIGAYTTAILMSSWSVPYWATLPISAVICAGFGFLIGLPVTRALGKPVPDHVQAAVKRAVLGLVVFDAVLATAAAGELGLILLLLLPPALFLGRRLYST
jgi:ABC-type branched-subunit amino acid transport system permease subunit